MFTQMRRAGLRSRLVGLLAGPHGVDRYTELVDPMWTAENRATVVRVDKPTPRSVTLWLRPNHPVTGFRAGQHLAVTVEVDGRRHTRCYSPANAEGAALIELTIARHPGGVVSDHLHRAARPGLVVGLSSPAGDFVLPTPTPRRLLLVAGGSGITPVMSIARTLREGGRRGGEVAVLHYTRTVEDSCYRRELKALPRLAAFGACTRGSGGDLLGRFGPEHVAAVIDRPDAVLVCGPPALVGAVRRHYPDAIAESFAPAPLALPGSPGGGRITFADSGIRVEDDGRTLLDQAESAGLAPRTGCRMGICHICTRRKARGAVRDITTGAISTDDLVRICVSVPVGDVELAL